MTAAGDGEIKTPRCEHCGQAIDDIQKMTEADVLKHIQTEMLKELLRVIRNGDATHQEMAIARGLLRDNSVVASKEDDDDNDGLKPSARRKKPQAEEYEFMKNQGDDTEGG